MSKKAEVVSIINQKGGVGKSTTAFALGVGLSERGYKVLFIDLDAQGNLTYVCNAINKPKGAFEVLNRQASAKDVIVNTEFGDVIPSTPELACADVSLIKTGKEFRLKEAIAPLLEDYDFIIIDTPPSLGVLMTNGLTCSDKVIIPSEADVFSLRGITLMQETVDTIKEYCNGNLEIDGILITRFNPRTCYGRDYAKMTNDTVKEELGTDIYTVPIRDCVSLKEAHATQESIYKYAPSSNACADYTAFVDEFLEKRGKK